MRVDPHRPPLDTRLRSHRVLLASVSLAVLVVAASGVAGTTRFAGPRWVPYITLPKASRHRQLAQTRTSTRPVSTRSGGHLPTWVVIAGLGALAAVALVFVALWLWRRWPGRRSRPAASRHSVAAAATSQITVEPEPDTPAVRSAIELALQVLDEQRDPADAIVRAWLGLQQTAEESGIVRAPAETPTEFTSRIVGRAVNDDQAIRTLLRLYLRTRFGDHPVTAGDVALVRAAVAALVRAWPARGIRGRRGCPLSSPCAR